MSWLSQVDWEAMAQGCHTHIYQGMGGLTLRDRDPGAWTQLSGFSFAFQMQ